MTTRALAVLAAAVAVIVATATILIWSPARDTPPAAAPQPTPSVAAATPSPSYNPEAGDAAQQEGPGPAEVQEAAWGPVVDTFARNFTNTSGGATDWRRRLIGDPDKPDVTTEVAGQLKTVDLRNVPEGRYMAYDVLEYGDDKLVARVDYDTGWSLAVYVISEGTKWRIYQYDRYEQ